MTSRSVVPNSDPSEGDEPTTFSAPFMIVDDFLPKADADAMRSGIEAHFGQPHLHSPESHQVWNYWHVPGLYTYLRTTPEKVIERALVESFFETLAAWARRTLGLGSVTWPFLSLYVDGCEQTLHNDSTNGRFGFVYSLTADRRTTSGGETIVLKEGDLFRANMGRPCAGRDMFDLIEPSFNRLTLFDDRMPHGVKRVEGPMDPLEGRFVLHGHISESGPMVAGALEVDAVLRPVRERLEPLLADVRRIAALHHGPVVLRFTIEPSGAVSRVDRLVDRLAREDGERVTGLVDKVLERVRSMRFAKSPGSTEVTMPLLFGGQLAWMRRPAQP